ncbi:sensor histidine kinase [Rhizobium terrae]|uniref:sensor histidine kinase n=1 Tax=Rhizobium terrae TaxID=2171756 RepID=UPI0019688978|nr:sensor histidine kinase [Rhizobium terrae]
MDRVSNRKALPRSAALVLIAIGLASFALLTVGHGDYPDLHTILDTGLALQLIVLTPLLWDMGEHGRSSFPKWLAITFAATSVLAIVHVLVTVEWSGPLAIVARLRDVLRPSTWPPATHLLPIGVGWALWRMHRKVTGGFLQYGLAIVFLGTALFAAFQRLPTYLPPGPLGITRPFLILSPLLWLGVGAAAWRLRSMDRLAQPLVWMAGTLFLANTVMLYSRAPADAPAMVAHLGRMGGYLVLLLSAMQMASSDLVERTRAEAALARLNEDLDRQVSEQTAQLREAAAQLSEALAQRTSALQELAKSEEQFRASFEAAGVGKALVEPGSARILRVNPAFAHMIGYEPDELKGRSAWEFTWAEDRPGDQAEYARFLAGEVAAYVREKRYLRRDGEAVWGRISGTLARSPELGEPGLMIAVIENVDERHKAEMALLETKKDLEIVVEERTAALQQRDILLREVYHRVKNNLQVIDSLLMMQAKKLTDPDAKVALQSLRKRVYALGLVHHQLMGSANLKSFDVAPFLKELTENIVEGGAERGINLSVDAIPLDVGLDFAVPMGLLVTELVTNALKHAFPDRTGNVSVTLQREDDGKITLVVADDGQGQAESETATGQFRPGLGAGIIAGLVAQLGGTMTIHSNNGTRTEIRVKEPKLS